MTTGQVSVIKKAWRALAAKKQLKGAMVKIGANNSLIEAFEAGWLVF
jgi:50S ribosomal protein L16 3-hydroxylase